MRGYTTSLLGKQSRNDSLRELQQFDGQVTWFLLSAVNLKVFWIRELPCLSLPNPRSSQCFRAKAVSKLRPRCERAGPHRAGRTLQPCSPGHAGPVSQGSPISVTRNESRCFFSTSFIRTLPTTRSAIFWALPWQLLCDRMGV